MATFPSKVNYATGDILTATNMNDVGGAINLLESAQFAAGKNKVINGDFGVWQRGTSFSNPSSGAYNTDRWLCFYDGTGATRTISQQTFTPGTAPVAGYEGQFFLRYALTVAGTSPTYAALAQRIEDVRTYAGQTVTLSYWAKASSGVTLPAPSVRQDFGSGGSGSVYAYGSGPVLTTSWVRYTTTITVPSISGKTVGTSSYLELQMNLPVTANTIDFWGVQLEAASTASPFQTATGTKQGELAACQRYYYRNTPASTYGNNALGYATGTTAAVYTMPLPVPMRITPTVIEYSNLTTSLIGTADYAFTGLTITGVYSGPNVLILNATGSTGLTQYRTYNLINNNNAAGYLGISAEL